MRRICFVGASHTEGMGDEAGLGWPGRLCQAQRDTGDAFVAYNLGVRGQTLNQVRKRARGECNARLLQAMGPLILIGTGANDLSRFSDGDYKGQFRTPRGGLLRTLETLIAELQEMAPVLVVGPGPVDEAQMPYQMASGLRFDFSNDDIAAGNALYQDKCRDMDVPFFNLYEALKDSPGYRRALREGDGLHPTGHGYQLCAEAIGQWTGWKRAMREGWAK